MALVFISEEPLSSNHLEFENNAIAGQNQGVLEWAASYKDGGIWYVDYSGKDVYGNVIEIGTIEIAESQKINPTKVAWWLLEKITDLICPDCTYP